MDIIFTSAIKVSSDAWKRQFQDAITPPFYHLGAPVSFYKSPKRLVSKAQGAYNI